MINLDKTKGYSNRYLNDFNRTSVEPNYDYDLTKNYATNKDETKNQNDDDNLPDIIYPDPETFHRRMLNKTKFGERHDESIIKICKLICIIILLIY